MMDNVLVGNVCADPVLRQPTRGSRPVARFTIAVNTRRRVGDEYVERPPVFHRVVCFGTLAENVTNSLRKGMEVLAMGEWADDSYSDEHGQRRTQIVLEARTVGPGLRWATATVARPDRTAAVRADTTAVPDAGSTAVARVDGKAREPVEVPSVRDGPAPSPGQDGDRGSESGLDDVVGITSSTAEITDGSEFAGPTRESELMRAG